MSQTAVVICPGRGTYNAAELGYLAQHFPAPDLLSEFDAIRADAGQEPLVALDSAPRYLLSKHGRGDNAAGLIYAASLGDFLSINRAGIDIVAVTGNSMGWYTALACGGALSAVNGFKVANTMGTLMQEAMIGGQLVYPWMDDDWCPDLARRTELLELVAGINTQPGHDLSVSIHLGGMLVLAGNDAGLSAFEAAAPPVDRFPMRLANHAGFHSALQAPVAARGRAALTADLFDQPEIPMIDGRGQIWWPHSTDIHALHDYTLGHQVTQTYDFSHAISVAAREFAPDVFIILGPGTTMGGAAAQSLILSNWQGLDGKAAFKARQETQPLMIAMGMEAQRGLAV